MTAERRTYDLQAARPADWFQKVADTAPNFAQLCDAVGERFVAFALVAGVRISALAVDPRNSSNTQVTFGVGEGGDEHKMSLGDFRRCLTQALTRDEPALPEEAPELDSGEAQQSYLGVRTMLLAELFGIVPQELHVGGEEPPSVVIGLGGVTDEVTVTEFREIVREAVRREERAAEPQKPFSIDLGLIPEASDALDAGNHDRVIEILDAWAGPLATLLRTPQGQNLGDDAKASLGRALGLLGSAYAAKGEPVMAEEILRLGVQWVQDGPEAGFLFTELGRIALGEQAHGKAIGLLRRAMFLDGPKARISPLLAECFLARGRALAALVCLDDAVTAGVPDSELSEMRERALEKVREPYEALQKLLA